jgi:hypothetical protein
MKQRIETDENGVTILTDYVPFEETRDGLPIIHAIWEEYKGGN